MTIWEYEMVRVGGLSPLATALMNNGNNGWELAAVMQFPGTNEDNLLIFKRPKVVKSATP